MEPIPSNAVPSSASTAFVAAEPEEKTGSPDTAASGALRFESILKSVAAGQDGSTKNPTSAQGGRRTAIAGKEAEADTPALPTVPVAAWGTAAPAVPVPNDVVSAEAAPVPVLAGAATVPTVDGEKNVEPAHAPVTGTPELASHTAAAYGPENATPGKAVRAGIPEAAPASPVASASEPKAADPVPVLAGASTLLFEDGEKNAVPGKAVRAGIPEAAPASPITSVSEPKAAGPANADPVTVVAGATTLPAGETPGAEGIRKRKDDASARNEGQTEPVATQPVDGNRGVAGRAAAPRPVGPASDPGVVRFDEKAFVITRKSDTSVEVTLAPPGVGKLDIEVVLEKGVVNARIIAADSAGREEIARSLPRIVEALARDGMNIGGFTVSLKERRDRPGDAAAHGVSSDPDARLLSAVPRVESTPTAPAGIVDIFV